MEKKPSLYESLCELNDLYFKTERELEQNGGELTPEIEEALDLPQEQLSQKVDGIKGYIASLEARTRQIDETIKALQDKKKSLQNAQRNFKSYVLGVMRSFGLDNIKGNIYTAYVRKTRSLEVDESVATGTKEILEAVVNLREALPNWIDVSIKVNKTEVKDEYKGTEVLPVGMQWVENESLTIR